ncbi:hypothetical protein T05_8404 [Trichinella murrelli]|uniref:Uncharacterized protein n=1 Tax=Trichinella murrelli TaxID=144512 RepID=A0A0V0UBC2_9BILA|nr:hypothetical protein T05_8404 [Trichinella murrelli]
MVRNNGAPDGATLARTNINYRWLPVGRQCAEALMFSQRSADGHLMAPLRQPPLRSSDSQPHMLVVRRRDLLSWSIIRRHTSNGRVTPTRSASFPLEQHFRSPINLIFDFLDYTTDYWHQLTRHNGMDDKRLLIKSLNVPTVSEVFMVAITGTSKYVHTAHILLITPSIFSVYRYILIFHPAFINKGHTAAAICTTGSSSTYRQLAAWSTHRDYLCLWHSLKSFNDQQQCQNTRALYEGQITKNKSTTRTSTIHAQSQAATVTMNAGTDAQEFGSDQTNF